MVTLEGTNSYAYDARGQLTAVTYPDGSSEAFAYDPVGNRTSLVQAASGGPAIETVYAYGPANRLLFSESAVETNVYTFDDAGRLVGQTVNGLSRTYAYDFQSRMTSLTDTNGAVFAYAFDGEGNRVRQSLNDCLSTRFVYDGANAVAEMNASNEVVWAWIHGPGLDQPVERIAFINGETRNRQVVHADGLGSVSALTDENGEPVQTYAYAAFGGIRNQTRADLNRVTFTAREALGDSLGFIYYRHRVYDPAIGRFTSEDPMGFVAGANRYVYVGNEPVNFIDPLGLEDINLYGPSTIKRAASDLRTSSANEITVGGEGAGGVVIDLRSGQVQVLTPAALAAEIKALPNYDPNKTVQLGTCEGAQGDNSTAKQLSTLLPNPIRGATGTTVNQIGMDSSGRVIGSSPTIPNPNDRSSAWVTYQGGNNSTPNK